MIVIDGDANVQRCHFSANPVARLLSNESGGGQMCLRNLAFSHVLWTSCVVDLT
jgi:hypothetical protein